MYVFTSDKNFRNKGKSLSPPVVVSRHVSSSHVVFENTKSGAAVANDTIISPGIPGAPVGGVGASGCECTPLVGLLSF